MMPDNNPRDIFFYLPLTPMIDSYILRIQTRLVPIAPALFFHLKSAYIFLKPPQKHMLRYSLEMRQQGTSNEYPQCMFWGEIIKIIVWIPRHVAHSIPFFGEIRKIILEISSATQTDESSGFFFFFFFRNCSCNREAQMCDKCGICQRCVIFLTVSMGDDPDEWYITILFSLMYPPIAQIRGLSR